MKFKSKIVVTYKQNDLSLRSDYTKDEKGYWDFFQVNQICTGRWYLPYFKFWNG
jgi:hypothetical protein